MTDAFIKQLIIHLRREGEFPPTTSENFVVNKVLHGIANALEIAQYKAGGVSETQESQ